MHLLLVGLGRMGCGLGARLSRAGHTVTGFDPAPEARLAAEIAGISTAFTLEDLVGSTGAGERRVWVMVPAGTVTEQTVAALADLLGPGDSVVEGGNSDYRDSMRRHDLFAAKGVGMLDVGTSGGVLGAEKGYSLMIGGAEALVEAWRPVFEALAPSPLEGWAHVGPSGAGHFAKMVHNAIEYGLMQAYAEGITLLSSGGNPTVDVAAATRAWRHGSIVSSTLMDLTAGIVAEGGLERVRPYVDDSGHGRLAVETAIERGVAMPVITQSLIARIQSRDQSSLAARLLAAMRGRFGGHAVHKADAL